MHVHILHRWKTVCIELWFYVCMHWFASRYLWKWYKNTGFVNGSYSLVISIWQKKILKLVYYNLGMSLLDANIYLIRKNISSLKYGILQRNQVMFGFQKHFTFPNKILLLFFSSRIFVVVFLQNQFWICFKKFFSFSHFFFYLIPSKPYKLNFYCAQNNEGNSEFWSRLLTDWYLDI